MTIGDQLHRFTFERSGLRGEIVVLAASWKAVVARHDYMQAVRDYLGQTLAAATLLSGTIKFKGSLILQVQGDGPLKTLVAQATDQRTIRGMASSEGEVPAGNLAAATSHGRLVITAESPRGERYQGIVGIGQPSVAGVVQEYFAQSEQLATRVWLAADERNAAGLLLQRLPGSHDDDDWHRVGLLGDTLRDEELLGLAPQEILRRLFHEDAVRLYEPEPAAFRCGCSRERIADALRSMGQQEVESIIAENGVIEADCEFCNAHYRFDGVDVAALFAASQPLHNPESRQ